MAKNDELEDELVLEDIGVLSWQEAIELEPQPSGLTIRQPTPEMLEPNGAKIEITDKRGRRKFICVYDEEYVCFHVFKSVLRPLGIINNKGEVKKQWLQNTLLPRWIAYAEAETDRVLEKKYQDHARTISELNGQPYEVCLEFVKGNLDAIQA